MKKRHSIHLLLAAAALLLATAACTKDELADGDRLPEGQYPLEIARITLGVEGGEAQPWGAPATRVSETADGTGSVFDTGDPFAVQIDDGTETATYTVQDDGTATSDAPLYWTNTTPNRTVSAWYPATDGTLDLGDQSQSLAYLLGGSGTGDYQTPVTLTFTHQLAKVRITPSDDALGEVQSLQLYTYTQCTYEKGNAGQGSQEGWIEMKKCEYTENGTTITCWEANVVPGYEIKQLRANGTEERDLSATFTPEAGKFYNITLDKDKGYTDDGHGNYTVTSAEGLKNIAELVNEEWKLDINITLTNNIDLTGIDWTPIGKDDNKAYTGTFDGNGKTITGLTVTRSNRYTGLFGFIKGTVKNVVLTEVNITSGTFVGGVAGWSFGGNIENCSVSGSVSGSSGSDVGGVVGYQQVGSITGCSSSATVKGTERAGGVVGVTNGGTTPLTACYATGNVTVENDGTSNAWAGGIVGMNGTGTLIACYAAGNVSGNIVGGAVGVNYATVTACYWSGLPDNDNGGATKVDGTTVTWQNAVDAMNNALNGSGWQYELTGALPTLKKQ
ncbi:MAG: GLUG motif-containing protein [Alistipes senegalensis]|uniref:GLUG motif-containing protein n=1 Tax=Alistipes senegalensis TaxID=1288121 RepID=UPI00242DFAEF|nr:GLUG motif-containing protein [Alistipes senegalensis]MDD7038351.1 GLUG motif-containing protein [Alistipes senegalensis]